MRFEFCGNIDCPEWVLSEISLINRMSAVKLKLVMAQIVKKISGSAYDSEKMQKFCRDSKMDPEETKCMIAIMEFLVQQAGKHDITEVVFAKDLTQMGLAIENANVITKSYSENQDLLKKSMANQSMRISKIENLNYKLSYVMASSYTGKNVYETEEGSGNWVQEPLDTEITLNF